MKRLFLGCLFLCLIQVVVCIDKEQNLLQIGAAKSSPEDEFRKWVLKHEKEYVEGSKEYNYRFAVWKDNLDFVHQYNAQGKSHWIGLNSLADLSLQEYQDFYLGFNPDVSRTFSSNFLSEDCKYCSIPVDDLPQHVDFREKGVVTRIKNQGACGSCWAFSSIASIESMNAIFGEELISLSEQEVLDCDTKDYSCTGGFMDDAFEFVILNGGVDTYSDYGYIAANEKCKVKKEHRDVVTIQAYQDVPKNNETALMQAAANQVISVAIQANQRPFQLYTGGVFDDECGDYTDHGVNVIGYGMDEENGVAYWIVRNSWGTGWGDNGYMKMRKDVPMEQGLCGIASSPSFPIKTQPNPPTPPKPSPSPSPSPDPSPFPPPSKVKCNDIQSCDVGSSCCCKTKKLQGECLEFGCCPIPNAVCCSDLLHCCPEGFQCDLALNSCTVKKGLKGEPLQFLSVPMRTKYPAYIQES